MPLTAEVIWKPAKAGQRLGRVIAQRPEGGTLSSWSNVRIILPHAANGPVPDVVGLSPDRARARLARRMIEAKLTYVEGADAGIVMSQFPRAGLAATRNMTVRLVIGRG